VSLGRNAPPALGVVLDMNAHLDPFTEPAPERYKVVHCEQDGPASSAGPRSYRAELFTSPSWHTVAVVRADDTGVVRRWIPVGDQSFNVQPGVTSHVRFDGLALLPATVNLRARATASPAVTNLRSAWLALGLRRSGGSGETLERSRMVLLPPPPASLAAQTLTGSVSVPAGEYAPFASGPGWRWNASESLRCELLQSLDVAVGVEPPLVAREVRVQAEDGTALASAWVQLWFDGVHALPRGERLTSVAALTDVAGRIRAIGPAGGTLHARIARDQRGALVQTRPAPITEVEPASDGSVVMALGAEVLVLTLDTP
jgi:hypothetical protein